jgi:hypothetical protein
VAHNMAWRLHRARAPTSQRTMDSAFIQNSQWPSGFGR